MFGLFQHLFNGLFQYLLRAMFPSLDPRLPRRLLFQGLPLPTPPAPVEQQSSYFNRLPPELIQEIFGYSVPLQENLREWSFIQHAPPISLLYVCRRWREIALATPTLWASIYIGTEVLLAQHLRRHVNLLLDIRNSSRHFPLSFDLQASHYNNDLTRRVVEYFISHQGAWKYARINVEYRLLSRRFIGLTTPNLRTLILEMESDHDHSSELVESFLKNSPALQNMTLRIPELIPRDFLPLIVAPVWRSLKTVDLHCKIFMTHILSLIYLAPNLHTLHIQGFEKHHIQVFHPNHILHRNLNSLRITGTTTLQPIFDYVTLPSLESLVVSLESAERIHAEDAYLAPFLQRSNPPLRVLAFENMPISEEDILQSLPLLPDLLSLELADERHASFTNAVIQCLGEPETCSHINNLRLIGHFRADDGLLGEMIEQRWARGRKSESGGRGLRSVHIQMMGPSHWWDGARGSRTLDKGALGRVRKKGLKMYIAVS